MSTLPNLILEFCDRIAAARGPKAWDRLRLEIMASPLKACQQLCLWNLIAKRFQSERAKGKAFTPCNSGSAITWGNSRNGVVAA